MKTISSQKGKGNGNRIENRKLRLGYLFSIFETLDVISKVLRSRREQPLATHRPQLRRGFDLRMLNKHQLGKKAYYFTMDSFIAIFILAIGYSLVISIYSTAPAVSSSAHFSEDLLGLLRTGNAADFGISTLNKDNTILEALGEAHYRKDSSVSKEVRDLIIDNNLALDDHGYNLSIEGVEVVSQGTEYLSTTKVIVPARRIVFGYYQDGTETVFWGPYEVEVKTWQFS